MRVAGCLCFYKYLNFDPEFWVYIWCLRLDVGDSQTQIVNTENKAHSTLAYSHLLSPSACGLISHLDLV